MDGSVPCFSADVEHDIVFPSRVCDESAILDSTESVCGSSSRLKSRFSHDFSPRAVCYSSRDVHDFEAQTGEPNYLVARVPVPSNLNISTLRIFRIWLASRLYANRFTHF